MSGGLSINHTSANETIPDIELLIRVVRERKISVRHSLPLNKTPKLLTIYIIFKFIRMINYFPVKGGISFILSTKTIMTSETIHYKQHLGLNIGKYFQVHEH